MGGWWFIPYFYWSVRSSCSSGKMLWVLFALNWMLFYPDLFFVRLMPWRSSLCILMSLSPWTFSSTGPLANDCHVFMFLFLCIQRVFWLYLLVAPCFCTVLLSLYAVPLLSCTVFMLFSLSCVIALQSSFYHVFSCSPMMRMWCGSTVLSLA